MQKYYSLLFIEKIKSPLSLFQCECGKYVKARIRDVKLGRTKSCGCKKGFYISLNRKTHGDSWSKEHVVWMSMKSRCYNPNNISYPNYGGRGIKVCDRWLNSFENFLADMGEKPSSEYSIDRIDVNGDYSPQNCKWATRLEQSRNRRNRVYITYNNDTKTVQEWSAITNISVATLRDRVRNGWSAERTLLTKSQLSAL